MSPRRANLGARFLRYEACRVLSNLVTQACQVAKGSPLVFYNSGTAAVVPRTIDLVFCRSTYVFAKNLPAILHESFSDTHFLVCGSFH